MSRDGLAVAEETQVQNDVRFGDFNPEEQAYPPETYKHLAWDTREFIRSPTSTKLDVTITALIISFVLFLALSTIIKLDVSVRAPAEITAEGGVRELVAPIDGVVTKLFKRNGDHVKDHEVIARIQMEDDAYLEFQKVAGNVEALTKRVESVRNPIDLSFVVGDLTLTRTFDPMVLQSLANVEHAAHDFQRDREQTLVILDRLGRGSGSEVYHTKERIGFLTRRLKAMMASKHKDLLAPYIDSTIEELGRLKSQVTSAEIRVETTLNQGYAELVRTLRIATGSLDDYRRHHEVVSPVSGVVGKIIEGDHIHLALNGSLATIIPENSAFIARVRMKSKDIVKLRKDQRVFYKMEAFPYQRYGLFEGTVLEFDQLRDAAITDDTFTMIASITPPENMRPDLEKRVRFIVGMHADATVILERKSLYDIFIEKFFKLTDI